MNFLGKGDSFLGAVHIRFGDNLNQRRAGTVEVDAGEAAVEVALVKRLARILFQVGVVNSTVLLLPSAS